MIEFKGECGHTIRAKDEDAGKVVRCSYCGHEAPVPDEREDHLDFLLNEVERTGEFKAQRGKRSSKAKNAEGTPISGRRSGDFNPFAVALKMCYAAIIITVLIVAGKLAYKEVFNPSRRPSPTKPLSPSPSGGGPVVSPDGGGASGTARGLLRPELPANTMGILVNAVPAGAQVYVRRQNTPATPAGPADSSILQKPDQRVLAGVKIENLPGSGTYDLAVTLPVLHPHLTGLPGYLKQWRDFEDAATAKDERVRAERLETFKGYFLPDRCKRVSVETLPDHSQVIVRYYDVQVFDRSWTVETALFLPKVDKLSDLMKFLPSETLFGFDPAPVKAVLTSYEVDPPDQTFILDALARVGMIPYRVDKKEKSYRLFFLGVADGAVSTVRLD